MVCKSVETKKKNSKFICEQKKIYLSKCKQNCHSIYYLRVKKKYGRYVKRQSSVYNLIILYVSNIYKKKLPKKNAEYILINVKKNNLPSFEFILNDINYYIKIWILVLLAMCISVKKKHLL